MATKKHFSGSGGGALSDDAGVFRGIIGLLIPRNNNGVMSVRTRRKLRLPVPVPVPTLVVAIGNENQSIDPGNHRLSSARACLERANGTGTGTGTNQSIE